MSKYNYIEDAAIRNAINDIVKRLDRIESVPQIPRDSSVSQIVDVLNKITKSMKRKR